MDKMDIEFLGGMSKEEYLQTKLSNITFRKELVRQIIEVVNARKTSERYQRDKLQEITYGAWMKIGPDSFSFKIYRSQLQICEK